MRVQPFDMQQLYRQLLTLYPSSFRQRFGDSMMQNFNDLCRERQGESFHKLYGYAIWLFIETTQSIIYEWLQLVIQPRSRTMEIKYMSILVNDQDKALKFYTEKLGFVKKADMQDGDSPLRWLTVVSAKGDQSVELELQHTYFPSAEAWQKDQYEAGYAFAVLQTQDIFGEYARLKQRGVVFRGEPEDTGPVFTVKFEDTCGNLINLIQPKL